MADGISGPGIAATAIGGLFLWAAFKGASPTEAFRSLVTGKEPSGLNTHPIDKVKYANTADNLRDEATNAVIGAGGGNANSILTAAASKKGQPYAFGGGHSGDPCKAKYTDCSSYVSCVLNMVGIMKGSMTTGGFAKFGVGVPYSQRLPGDLIIWNGGTGGGHMGIIIDGSHMWHNPCTACGGVQIGKYPYGSRSASSAIVRRVAK